MLEEAWARTRALPMPLTQRAVAAGVVTPHRPAPAYRTRLAPAPPQPRQTRHRLRNSPPWRVPHPPGSVQTPPGAQPVPQARARTSAQGRWVQQHRQKGRRMRLRRPSPAKKGTPRTPAPAATAATAMRRPQPGPAKLPHRTRPASEDGVAFEARAALPQPHARPRGFSHRAMARAHRARQDARAAATARVLPCPVVRVYGWSWVRRHSCNLVRNLSIA